MEIMASNYKKQAEYLNIKFTELEESGNKYQKTITGKVQVAINIAL